MRYRRAAVAALLVATIIQCGHSAPPAAAEAPQVCQHVDGLYPSDCPRFGQPGNFLANNRTHRVDFHDTLKATGDAAQWVLDNRFPELGFSWVWVDGTDYDVRIKDDYYPDATWFGKTTCPSGATKGGSEPRRWCYGQLIRVNLSNQSAFDTTFGRRVVLCHELGHSVGLNHPEGGYVATSCLENESIPDEADSARYDDVDQNNVKRAY